MKLVHCLRVIAVSAVLGACSSDSSTAPTKQAADLAQVLNEMALPSLSGAASLAGAPVAGFSAPTPSGCTYSASTQSFGCANVTITGLTIAQSYTLLDGSGHAQSAFDPATTAAVRLKTTVVGTITSDGTTLVIDQAQDLMLSGLLTGVHTIDGTSTTKLNGRWCRPRRRSRLRLR